jgi:hypothetical protein
VKPKVEPIPIEAFEKVFKRFYLQRGEWIGGAGDESLDRYEARLESFYETFQFYKLERLKQAMQSYQEGHSSQEKFPSNGDLLEELNNLPAPTTKFAERKLTEEDRIANEKLQEDVKAILAGKKPPKGDDE